MKSTEYREGPDAARGFSEEVSFLLSVPRSTILKRETTYRKTVDANPNRRGPKRKVKPSASLAPDAS